MSLSPEDLTERMYKKGLFGDKPAPEPAKPSAPVPAPAPAPLPPKPQQEAPSKEAAYSDKAIAPSVASTFSQQEPTPAKSMPVSAGMYLCILVHVFVVDFASCLCHPRVHAGF
jgi:hypothetical protein